MTAPKRVQLSRKKGWRKPGNCVVVSRPGRWGNPYKIGGRDHNNDLIENRADAAHAYRAFIEDMVDAEGSGRRFDLLDNARAELRGKDLACWCPLDEPCHADVLLEVANTGPKRSAGHAASRASHQRRAR